MRRNMFGEPQPATFDEISEVMNDADLNPSQCSVTILDSNDEDYPFKGWTAEIIGPDGTTINTLGFTDPVELESGLNSLGFNDVTFGQ